MNGVNIEWHNFDLERMRYTSNNLSKSIYTACTYRDGKLWAAHPTCTFLAVF